MYKLSETINRKFIEQLDVSDWQVESNTGYVDVLSSNKTIPYEVYHLEFENGLSLDCADTHILIDSNGDEIFAADSLGVMIKTSTGPSTVILVAPSGVFEEMYDLSVDSVDHTYYTNGILSHNTTTSAAYILWYTLFQDSKSVAILANKASAAREVLSRYKLMYEHLPKWLQQGVTTWNKGDVELENGSIVFTAATSASGIRGKSCVTSDTKVTLIDAAGCINYLTIEQLIEQCKSGPDKNFWSNTKFDILSSKGFRNFQGVICQGEEQVLKISFDLGASIRVTPDHKFQVGDRFCTEWVSARDLKIGMSLNCKHVTSIEPAGTEVVYDILAVEEVNNYYSNGVISHNCNMLYVDEAAIIPNTVADQFFASVYPTISAGTSTKILLSSTPMGYNHFWKFWNDAENDRNGFVNLFIPYTDIPGRDEAWATEQHRLLGDLKYNQEILCVGPHETFTIRDKYTHEIMEVSAKELFNIFASRSALYER